MMNSKHKGVVPLDYVFAAAFPLCIYLIITQGTTSSAVSTRKFQWHTRTEVSAPPTSLYSIANSLFLREASSEPSRRVSPSHPPPRILLLLAQYVTRARPTHHILLSSIANLISAISLRNVAKSTLLKNREGFQAVLTPSIDVTLGRVFLWNPLTLAVALSGSGDAFYLAAFFTALEAAASSHNILAACVAFLLALHVSKEPQMLACTALPLAYLLFLPSQSSMSSTHSPRMVSMIKDKKSANIKTGSSSSHAVNIIGFIIIPVSVVVVSAALVITTPSAGGIARLTWNPIHILKHIMALITPNNAPFSFTSTLTHVLTPNIGLHWYLAAQVFPIFRPLFHYLFTLGLPLSMGLAIAFRWVRKDPLAVLVAQGMVVCMLSHHPTYADILLWLHPLIILLIRETKLIHVRKHSLEQQPQQQQPQQQHYSTFYARFVTCMAVGLPLILLLNTAAYETWLTLNIGNANFYYGMNLAWAAWLATALIQLVKYLALKEERKEMTERMQ